MRLRPVAVAILIGASSVAMLGSPGVAEQHRAVGGSTDNCPGANAQRSATGGAYWCPPPTGTDDVSRLG
ncbi:hypothetical protein [Flexivirga sp. B27]